MNALVGKLFTPTFFNIIKHKYCYPELFESLYYIAKQV